MPQGVLRPWIEAHPEVEWHLVGRLQSNKADEAVRLFHLIHSLDRPKLIAALYERDKVAVGCSSFDALFAAVVAGNRHRNTIERRDGYWLIGTSSLASSPLRCKSASAW